MKIAKQIGQTYYREVFKDFMILYMYSTQRQEQITHVFILLQKEFDTLIIQLGVVRTVFRINMFLLRLFSLLCGSTSGFLQLWLQVFQPLFSFHYTGLI